MDDFFAVFEAAKDIFGLSRLVHIDLEKAYFKIYQDEHLIISYELEREGTQDEIVLMYHQVAQRLINWIKRENQ